MFVWRAAVLCLRGTEVAPAAGLVLKPGLLVGVAWADGEPVITNMEVTMLGFVAVMGVLGVVLLAGLGHRRAALGLGTVFGVWWWVMVDLFLVGS